MGGVSSPIKFLATTGLFSILLTSTEYAEELQVGKRGMCRDCTRGEVETLKVFLVIRRPGQVEGFARYGAGWQGKPLGSSWEGAAQ